MRELDNALALSDLASCALSDNRSGKKTRHRLDDQFRQWIHGRLGGYEDVNDADRLALDPVIRQIVGAGAVDTQAASAIQVGRFETETLPMLENRAAQDTFVNRAEKRGCTARVMRAQALLPDRARCSARKTLDPLARSGKLASNGRPRGGCR